jgi:putative hydrolase of the HAD superfamily
MNKKIEAIVFDIGDTLVDATGIAQKALVYAAVELQNRGLIENHGSFCEVYSNADSRVQGVNINHLYSGIQILSAVADKLNVQKRHLLYYDFFSIYRNKVKDLIVNSPYDVRKIFADLKNRNIKIGILSDGTTYEQIEQLYLLDVLNCVDEVVTSQELQIEKPDIRMFSTVLSRLNCKAENSIMVGDDAVRDMDGANRAGMITVLLSQYKKTLRADEFKSHYVVKSLDELLKIL